MKNIKVKTTEDFLEKYDLDELLYSDIAEMLTDIITIESEHLKEDISFRERVVLQQQIEILKSSAEMFRVLYYPTLDMPSLR